MHFLFFPTLATKIFHNTDWLFMHKCTFMKHWRDHSDTSVLILNVQPKERGWQQIPCSPNRDRSTCWNTVQCNPKSLLTVCTKQNKNRRITRLAIRRVGVWPSSVLSLGDSPCNQPPPCFRFQMYKMEIISTSLRAPTCLKMESWNPVANPLLVGLPTCPYASWLHFDTSQLDSTTPKTLPTDTKIVTLAKSAAPLQIL